MADDIFHLRYTAVQKLLNIFWVVLLNIFPALNILRFNLLDIANVALNILFDY